MPVNCRIQGERTGGKYMVRLLPDHRKVMYGASEANGTLAMVKGQRAR